MSIKLKRKDSIIIQQQNSPEQAFDVYEYFRDNSFDQAPSVGKYVCVFHYYSLKFTRKMTYKQAVFSK